MFQVSIFIGLLALVVFLIAKRVGAKKGVSEIDDLNYYFDDLDNYNDCENDSPKIRHRPGDES